MEEKNAGLEALKRIRESGNEVPFYLLSGGSLDEKTALQNGATGFYRKEDFDSDKVLADMAEHLQ